MLFMKLVEIVLILMFLAACYKTDSSVSEKINKELLSEPVKSPAERSVKKTIVPSKFTRAFREAIYFAGSLEREASKLLLKEVSYQRNTLFTVLSYIVESNSGSKKSAPLGLDCGKFEVKFLKNQTIISKACQKPAQEAIIITTLAEDQEYELKFVIAQWGHVIGTSAMFTGADIKCNIRIANEKLNVFSCQNWTQQMSEDQFSATILKTTEFMFQRHAEKQFVIRGGHFKELVQNKKIDIVVPLEGKIKIIEKELKVIDDFIDQKNGVSDEKKIKIEINPAAEEKSNGQENQRVKEAQTNFENSSQEADQQSGEISPGPVENQGYQNPQPEGGRRGR